MFSRRMIFSFLAALIATGLGGCPSFSSIEADITTYVPYVLSAVAGVLALFNPALALLLTPYFNEATAAIAGILSAIQTWKDADATQKPGVVGDIIAALITAQQKLQSLLDSIGVNAPAFVAIATPLINIILGVFENFIVKLQAANPTPAAAVKMKATLPAIKPLNLNSKEFRAAWNSKCAELGAQKAAIQ